MVHSVEQLNLIDSLTTALDYSSLLDMFSSPLLPAEEEQQPPHTNIQGAIHLEKCHDPNSYDLVAQLMSNRVLEETPSHQIEGHDKSFGGDDNMMADSGSTQVPNDSKTTTTTRAIKPKKKGLPWTKSEHEYGKGDWKSIARTHVLTRTAAQVASHAQKYFARLKRVEETSGVHRSKAGVSSKCSHSLAKPVVDPTINVPPSDNGNVPTTFSNPTSDFGKVPHTFTHRRSEESGQTNSTIPFFPPWKFSKVNPTIYVPPSDVFLSDEDGHIPSLDFITKPTWENTNVPTTIYVPPLGSIFPDPDLGIHSMDSISAPSSTKFNVPPTISVSPLNDISTDSNVWIQSLDFPQNHCSDRITATSNPVYPLANSFPNHDVFRTSLDYLDALPSNKTLVHPTFYAPPSNISTFDPIITLPPHDFTSVHQAPYYTVSHTTSFTPSPSDLAYLPPQDEAYVIK